MPIWSKFYHKCPSFLFDAKESLLLITFEDLEAAAERPLTSRCYSRDQLNNSYHFYLTLKTHTILFN